MLESVLGSAVAMFTHRPAGLENLVLLIKGDTLNGAAFAKGSLADIQVAAELAQVLRITSATSAQIG